MKRAFPPASRFLLECAALLVLHLALLHIVAGTRVIEKVMAQQFGTGDLVLIGVFFASRLVAYFVVPAALVAFGISRLWKRVP